MMGKSFLRYMCLIAALAFLSTSRHTVVADKCASQLGQMNKCLGDRFLSKLDSLTDSDLKPVQTHATECLAKANCTLPEFGAPLWTLIEASSPYRQVVQKFLKLWDSIPDKFKICIGQLTGRRLANKLDTCLKQRNVSAGYDLQQIGKDIDFAFPTTDKQKKSFEKLFSTLVTTGISLMHCSQRIEKLDVLQQLNTCERITFQNSTFGSSGLCADRKTCKANDTDKACFQHLKDICREAQSCLDTTSDLDLTLRGFFSVRVLNATISPTATIPTEGKILLACSNKTGYSIPPEKFLDIVNSFPKNDTRPPPAEFKVLAGGLLALFRAGPAAICNDLQCKNN